MKNFIQEAMKEIEHVTWPTKAETKKYFTIVTTMIIVAVILLSSFGFLVTESMFAVRKITPHEVVAPITTSTDSSVLDSILGKDTSTVSGTAQPLVATGSVTDSNK